jgi:NAD(P)H-hydrate epimerase
MKLDDQTDSPLPRLAPRPADSNKGDFGRALLVGGSRGMSGAIAMAGLSTLRGGAGLVTLAVPQSVQNTVAGFSPCFMTHALADANGQFTTAAAAEVIEFGKPATILALGPGLGRSAQLTAFVQQIYRDIDKPMVVDADALFALAEGPAVLSNPGGPRVLTPHPGEFARFTGKLPKGAQRMPAAAELARRDASGNTVVVLKGHQTVVTDGTRYSLNHTGNPGMATGGSGDVLTGIVTALLCQSLTPFDAARLAVHIHGLAGDLAAAKLGQVSLIATDLIEFLPLALQSVEN